MRLAVLIANYVTIALLVLVLFNGLADPNLSAEEVANTFLGCIMYGVPITLSTIYAHISRDKK
jgi:hypothetical protein